MNTSAQPETRRWPPQIKFIVGNEACERFSYYGMRSILAGYITGAVLKGGLGQTDDTATEKIDLDQVHRRQRGVRTLQLLRHEKHPRRLHHRRGAQGRPRPDG